MFTATNEFTQSILAAAAAINHYTHNDCEKPKTCGLEDSLDVTPVCLQPMTAVWGG